MEDLIVTESHDRAFKIDSAIAVRCVKAAHLLSDLQISSADEVETAKKEVTAELKRQLTKLEIQLLKERQYNKKKRFHSLLELSIQIGIFFCLWIICLFLFFDFRNLY